MSASRLAPSGPEAPLHRFRLTFLPSGSCSIVSGPASISSPDRFEDDTAARQRIGPWDPSGVADLSDFDIDTNFFVRAAAGSGKTTSLVARMVGLVREGVPVDAITAITFTRKAAGEMSKRFYEELQQAYRGLPIETEQRRRVRRALQDVQSGFIGTVHAFCARLLRERPLPVELPPDFTAGIEPREERQLRDRAWREYLRSVRQENPERLERIIRLGIEPDDLTATFETLCRHPELAPYTNAPDESPDFDAAVRQASRLLRDWQARRPDAPEGGRDGVMKAFDTAEKMLQVQDLDEPAQKASFLSLFADVVSSGRAKVTLSRWGERGSDAYDEARVLCDEALPELVETVIEPVLRPWRAQVHRAVASFARPAVEMYRERRRRDGQLTFHDLLQFTRDLLRDHPDVRRSFQERYPRLLVDEFQDTDPLQAEILFYLASEDPTERSWSACTPRPGSLFIVGDDKQSIYRFRRADKDVFAQVGRLIDASGGEVVNLTKNFRSLGRICSFCNRAFGQIFEREEVEDLQADYVPFDPQRPPGADATAVRRLPIDKVHRNRGDDIASADAERIAGFIQQVVAGEGGEDLIGDAGDSEAVFPGGARYEDFLILTRTKTRISTYAQTLARAGIPYTVTGSEDLGDSDELRALVDLLTCALRPDDPVAAVAYLKGALAGWSDDDLFRFRQAGGRFDRTHEPVPDDVLRELSDERRHRIETAFRRLRESRRILQSQRPGVAISRLVEHLGVLPGAAHPPEASEGSLRAGYVLRILTVVEHLAAQGHGWAAVLDELQRILDGEEQVDGMTLETGSGSAVRLMNVHQAKGLEAPVVFLADPYSSGSAGGPTLHVKRKDETLVAPIVQGESYRRRVTHAPLGWENGANRQAGTESFRGLEERHQTAEEHRLLYVAATRAENLLVVSTYPEKPDDGYWSDLYPALEAVDAPVLASGAATEAESASVPAPDVEAHRTRRRRRIEAASSPRMVEQPVSERASGDVRLGVDPGYGSEFGTAVHTLFASCIRHRPEPGIPSNERVRAVLSDEGASTGSGAVDRARAMVHGLLSSRLWDDLCAGSEVYTEYPVSGVQAAADGPPSLVTGFIDVLYRDADGWRLADFKTDRVEDDRALEVLSGAYRPQIEAYASCWQEATGEPIVAAGLWFADVDTYVDVPVAHQTAGEA